MEAIKQLSFNQNISSLKIFEERFNYIRNIYMHSCDMKEKIIIKQEIEIIIKLCCEWCTNCTNSISTIIQHKKSEQIQPSLQNVSVNRSKKNHERTVSSLTFSKYQLQLLKRKKKKSRHKSSISYPILPDVTSHNAQFDDEIHHLDFLAFFRIMSNSFSKKYATFTEICELSPSFISFLLFALDIRKSSKLFERLLNKSEKDDQFKRKTELDEINSCCITQGAISVCNSLWKSKETKDIETLFANGIAATLISSLINGWDSWLICEILDSLLCLLSRLHKDYASLIEKGKFSVFQEPSDSETSENCVCKLILMIKESGEEEGIEDIIEGLSHHCILDVLITTDQVIGVEMRNERDAEEIISKRFKPKF
ncbi:uncharacterized protein MONOS_18580 [Monocercomonoides exilis]|uniref:uncharacterized protein n=1 Tax=Monocercomonoides exilis TaxID=2049356 RepID=UPI00355ABEE8|nr:hypothetical protein MONOS_18580 [Monocercomonoides exilis]